MCLPIPLQCDVEPYPQVYDKMGYNKPGTKTTQSDPAIPGLFLIDRSPIAPRKQSYCKWNCLYDGSCWFDSFSRKGHRHFEHILCVVVYSRNEASCTILFETIFMFIFRFRVWVDVIKDMVGGLCAANMVLQ